jgi:hypothetical protein
MPQTLFISITSHSTLTPMGIPNNYCGTIFSSDLLDDPSCFIDNILLPLPLSKPSKRFPNISIPSGSAFCYPSPPLRIRYNDPANISFNPIDLM